MTDNIQYWEGSDGQWYWHKVAPNNRVVSDGGEGYASEGSVLRAIERETTSNPDITIERIMEISSDIANTAEVPSE